MLQQTSIFAYEQEIRPNLTGKCMEVYSVIYNNSPLCNDQIQEILGWPINCITGRTRDLVKKFGMVCEDHKAIYEKTGRTVIFWRIK